MIQWKPIPEYMYQHWGPGEKEFRDFVATFGFDMFARAGRGSVVRAGKFLRCEKGFNQPTRKWYSRAPHYDVPPCLGNSLVFQKSGTHRRMWVYHPYIPHYEASTPGELVQKLEPWCNERGIIYVFCPQSKSFYYPGKSYMVMLMSEETYVDCLSIPGFPQDFEYVEEDEHHDQA